MQAPNARWEVEGRVRYALVDLLPERTKPRRWRGLAGSSYGRRARIAGAATGPVALMRLVATGRASSRSGLLEVAVAHLDQPAEPSLEHEALDETANDAERGDELDDVRHTRAVPRRLEVVEVPERLEGAGDLLVDEAAWTVELRNADGQLPGDPEVARSPGDLVVRGGVQHEVVDAGPVDLLLPAGYRRCERAFGLAGRRVVRISPPTPPAPRPTEGRGAWERTGSSPAPWLDRVSGTPEDCRDDFPTASIVGDPPLTRGRAPRRGRC